MLIHSLLHVEMLVFICYVHKYMDGPSNTITTVVRTGGGYGIGEVSLDPVSSKICINDFNNLSVCIDNNVRERSVFK